MTPTTIINAAANLVIAAAVVDMAIRVFGDPKHHIHAHPELFYIRKFISSLVISGAVLNVVTLSTPSWTECLLNLAFAGNYCFSSYYDRFARTPNSKISGKISKRSAPSRASNSRKGKPRSSSRGSGRKRPAA